MPGATGAEISITAQDGKHAVIIGKPIGEGNFARRSGEKTSYSVEPAISFETEPRYWIDSKLIDIAADEHPEHRNQAGGGARLHRPPRQAAGPRTKPPPRRTPRQGRRRPTPAETFTLDGVPTGRKAADSAALAPSPTALSALTADDVAPAGDVDFSKATVATVTLSDGNVITVTGAAVGDKHWIQLQRQQGCGARAPRPPAAHSKLPATVTTRFSGPLEQLLVPKATPPGAAKSAHRPRRGPKPAAPRADAEEKAPAAPTS